MDPGWVWLVVPRSAGKAWQRLEDLIGPREASLLLRASQYRVADTLIRRRGEDSSPPQSFSTGSPEALRRLQGSHIGLDLATQ